MYFALKTLHVLGVILLLGNVIVTLFWKMAADRTRNPQVVAFAQRMVTWTDWRLTVGGVVLLLLGGFGAAGVAHLDPFGVSWMIWGEILIVLSGLLWAAVLIPAQIRQARQASAFARSGDIPASYWRDTRRWVFWGVLAILPLLIAVWVMIAKPAQML